MKRIFSFTHICTLALGITCLASCYKDQGNYTYHAINEISFANFDTLTGYNATFGDTLNISPTLVMTLDKNPSPTGFTYVWAVLVGIDSTRDSVISTAADLSVKITLAPGTYTLQYKVTDKSTGVQWQTRTSLLVSTQVYEGYFVLNDVNGQSRLDMLSYKNGAFNQYTDVLKMMGSTLPPQGQPYKIFCSKYGPGSDITYGIFLLTASGTNLLNPETFGWDSLNNISYLMIGDVPAGFMAQNLTGEYTYGVYPFLAMYAGGNIYTYTTLSGFAFPDAPVNVYPGNGTTFGVSPYIATNGTMTIMYDTTAKAFAYMSSYSGSNASPVPVAWNFPTGESLLYMEGNYSNNVNAILQDPATGNINLLRFVPGSAENYYAQVTGTGIAQAEHYAVSPDMGYLFYNVGGKLYEYDLFLKTSFLMLDLGSSDITYLSFHYFFNRAANTNYAGWAKLLTVGSYDGANGTLTQYSVPTVNGQIVQANQWTGFGKIVSVSYRER